MSGTFTAIKLTGRWRKQGHLTRQARLWRDFGGLGDSWAVCGGSGPGCGNRQSPPAAVSINRTPIGRPHVLHSGRVSG